MAQHEVGLFGTKTRSDTLLVVSMLGETHSSEIARVLDVSLSQVQRSVDSLERAGILIGVEEGKTRRVRINPRFAMTEELLALLNRMALLDVPLQKRLATLRRRPRRSGKSI